MDGIRLDERFPRQVLNHVEHHKVSTPICIEEMPGQGLSFDYILSQVNSKLSHSIVHICRS